MNLDLFIEFLARLKENRLVSAVRNPMYPTSKVGLGATEAKGNALRQVQQIKHQKEQQQMMQQMLQQMQGNGDANPQ